MRRAASPRSWTVRSGEDFARALSGVRQSRGLTQAQLAELAGVRPNYLAKLEAGLVRPIVLDRVVRMLRRMGATVTIEIERDSAPSD
jgi:transcriptional regulator with XRE-family HTH domain